MTTTELIKLLQKLEFGASGRPRKITISILKGREFKTLLDEEDSLKFNSSGDGIAGAQLDLRIEKEK